MKSNEHIIKEKILYWTNAVSSGDREGILKSHSKDILMYDFPEVIRGINAYNKTWDFFFQEKVDDIRFEARNIEITAGEEVAFATCLIRCDGTAAGVVELRFTAGFKKIDNEWMFVHEHHSVPSVIQSTQTTE